MKHAVHFGPGEIRCAVEILDEIGADSVFLVCGGHSYEASGAARALEPALAQRRVTRFSDFDPNPDLEALERGLSAFRQSEHQVVLAVGGGTALDLAKLVAAFASGKASPIDVLEGRAHLSGSGPTLIAVPTTAGTGSEATHFAVLYVGHRKHSVAHPSMRPDFAIVDPTLTHSVPASVTATTGLDALAQAMESLWSVNSTEETATWAREAVDLAFRALPAVVQQPSADSRYALCRASHLAGKAIDVTKTTAPHALSYAMTAHFGVPHGHAVALTLGEMLVFNDAVTDRDVTDPRGPARVRGATREVAQLLGCGSAEAARDQLTDLIGAVGLEARLGSLGIEKAADFALLRDDVNVERLQNNPRALTPRDIEALLGRIA
jgi:alcohol dehydrogenase class IV